MSDCLASPLFHFSKKTYGRSFNTDLLEQYKLYVQSADNVSARRVSSNRYLLTVNSALVAAYSFQYTSSGLTIGISAVAGIAISILMWSIIKSHNNLNAVKFKIIHELEQHLPVALYGYEWQLAQEGRGKTYRSVSYIELWIPVAFVVIHSIILGMTLIPVLYNYICSINISSAIPS